MHPDDDDGDDDDDSQRNFTCSSNMLLYFKPAAQQLLENNPVPLKTIQWNKKQIDDFVRKLGFLEKQDVEQTVKQFQQLNEVSKLIINDYRLFVHHVYFNNFYFLSLEPYFIFKLTIFDCISC